LLTSLFSEYWSVHCLPLTIVHILHYTLYTHYNML
jgi:hypothetical protein